MANFHDLCHRTCALKCIEVIFELRKVDFGGLNGQFNVKKANFRGLLAKIDLFGAYLGFENPLATHFLDRNCALRNCALRNCVLRYVQGIYDHRKLDFGGL